MCGIAGILWSGTTPPDEAAAQRMADALSHRGPDALGVRRTRGCDLAHTRLKIVDPVGGSQPMTHVPSGQTLSFNGEIYNHRLLRKDLQRRGYSFQTTSDTEALLLGLVDSGESILEELNGQFAFVHWDEKANRLIAARDRLGEKPLYYAVDPAGRLIIASEIKAILASGLIRPTIRLSALQSCLTMMHTQPHETVYREIHALPPGHVLTWQDGNIQTQAYWQPSYAWRTDITRSEAVQETRRLIEQSVERQRVADVPVGAFLSGGLDSTTLVALLARQQTRPVKTFSVGFGDLINELPYARAVAEQYHTEHHEIQLGEPNVAELMQQMTRVYDEPFADSSCIATYRVSEFASRHVKSVIGGDGADELFGGYGWTDPLLRAVACRTGRAHQSMRWARYQAWRGANRVGRRFEKQTRRAAQTWAAGRAMTNEPDAWRRRIINDTQAEPSQIDARFIPNQDLRGVDRATDFDLRVFLPGDILTKVDRAAMAHGLETRSPFLDRDLVEFVLSLPTDLRLEVGRSKALLRDACADLWPEQIKQRSKQGFGAPLQAWLDRPDVAALSQSLNTKYNAIDEAFDGNAPIHCDHPDPQCRWNRLNASLWLEHHASHVHNDLEEQVPIGRAAA